MPAIVAQQFGRHAAELGVEEQIEKERGHQIVAMMAQRDLGEAFSPGVRIQRAAAQPRAQRTHGLALGHDARHYRVGVLFDDFVVDADGAQVVRQNVSGEARLLLIQIDRGDRKPHRRFLLQPQQNIEQRVAVFAAGETDHHLVAGFDHAEIGNGAADLMAQTLGQPGGFVRSAAAGWRQRFGERQDGIHGSRSLAASCRPQSCIAPGRSGILQDQSTPNDV